MARLATASLLDHVEDEVLLRVVRALNGVNATGYPDPAVPFPEDAAPELEPFWDWDRARGHGAGFFTEPPEECRSRRIDLRGPTDIDPGPLPMEEAPEDITARHLCFF